MGKIITSTRLGSSYIEIKHSSGLNIRLCPMKEFSTSYAMITTKYGSIDNCFKTKNEDEFTNVPEGIAHFLEHKMFENEKGDALELFAQTGASANAYTAFDKTSFFFSCTENFKESIEILLDFISKPFFTKDSVKKEQCIIEEEIKMFDDDPDWQVFYNLLCNLYHNHPASVDIAGTVDSIKKITPDLLYKCYDTFYNLNNMILTVAGGFDIEDVMKSADKILKPQKEIEIISKVPSSQTKIKNNYCEVSLPIGAPMFTIGFKQVYKKDKNTLKNQIVDEMLLEIIAGDTTDFYKELYDKGLINATFDSDLFMEGNCEAILYSGESRFPKEVYNKICERITELKKNGVSKEDFDIFKIATYGKYISAYSRVESIAQAMMQTYFMGNNLYDAIEIAANIGYNDIIDRLKNSLEIENSVLSVVSAE